MESYRGLPNEGGVRASAWTESPEATEPMPFQSAIQSQVFMGAPAKLEVLWGHTEMVKTQLLPENTITSLESTSTHGYNSLCAAG